MNLINDISSLKTSQSMILKINVFVHIHRGMTILMIYSTPAICAADEVTKGLPFFWRSRKNNIISHTQYMYRSLGIYKGSIFK